MSSDYDDEKDQVLVTTFKDCVMACWTNKELMREYRRLRGVSLGEDRRQVIEKMIDRVTGFEPETLDEREVIEFLNFVRDCIWLPLFFELEVIESPPEPVDTTKPMKRKN